METIRISTPSSHSEIICGDGAFENFTREFDGQNAFVVTDGNVFSLYGDLLQKSLPKAKIFVIKAGESSKNHRVLLSILQGMVNAKLTKKSRVIAFGGGVVGDIGGLAASLYMRGVELVQIPTTLLSQVDSSVGGKTAVDMCGVKNVIGTFYQPARVIVDPLFLGTLHKRELRCGLGEIIKYGALDGEILQKIAQNSKNLFDFGFLKGVTPLCIKHKARVVAMDERDENGARKSLNLGHTTGHAFELTYKRRSHGEYVLIGMFYELFIACNNGVCAGDYADKLRALIMRALGKIPALDEVSAAKYDKKNSERSKISLVVPKCEGEWAEITLNFDEYAAQIKRCAQLIRGEK